MSKYKVTHHSVRPSGGGENCAVGDVIELTDAEASERAGKIKLVVEKVVVEKEIEKPKPSPKVKTKAKTKVRSESKD